MLFRQCFTMDDRIVKKVTIEIAVQSDQLDLLDMACKELGHGRSEFVLSAAMEKAASVLADQVHFELSPEKFERFQALLECDGGQNPALDKLMATKPVWQTKS